MNSPSQLPQTLCHYYEAAVGPFVNLSDLSLVEAEAVLDRLRRKGRVFASQRDEAYLLIRRQLEDQVRHLFIQKGGRPLRARPHYMTLGACPWLPGWYQDGRELCIPLAAFDPSTVSFTYGDTFPAMRYGDGKVYRGQVYRLDELPELIAQFGLPQVCNPDGQLGPDRYIEAQIWHNAPLRNFVNYRKREQTNG
jgi:hypothetical protein